MTLRLTHPRPDDLAETPSEDALRALYPHAPGIVRLGMIAGADGSAAGPDGSSRSLGGPEDLRVLRVLRAAADVVLVGAATARREDYGTVTVREALAAARSPDQPPSPLVAVVTSSGVLPPGLNPGNALVVTTASSLAMDLGFTWGDSVIVAGDDRLSPTAVVNALASRGLTRILCEGGPTLARLLLDAGIVTDYCLTTSPRPGGADSTRVPPPPPSLELVHVIEGEEMTMRRWGLRLSVPVHEVRTSA